MAPPRKWKGWAILVVGILLGFAWGLASRPPPPLPITNEQTVTVTKTVEVPTPARLPGSCTSAFDYIKQINDASGVVIDAGPKQQDIMDAAFVAMLQKNWKALNDQRFKQAELKNSTTKGYVKILLLRGKAGDQLKACLSEVER